MSRKLLFFIVFIGFLLRVSFLARFPVGFTADEASFGYDAYSLLKTGKDQWGKSLPLVLESFGDYKAPLYAYLDIPSVFLFGLNKFSVRLPNAIVGTASIVVVYFLIRELIRKGLLGKLSSKKERLAFKTIPLAGSLLLALSSWHIMMSRGAFEATLTTFFLPLGIYLFLKGLEKSTLLPWSAFVFGLNLFTYHSAKLVTPLIMILLVVLYFAKLKANFDKNYKLAIFIVLLSFVLTAYTFTLGAGARVKDVSIFEGSKVIAAEDRLAAIENGLPFFAAKLLHNKYLVFTRTFISNYLTYFSFDFLFTRGPAETTYGMIPGRGVLFWFSLPFLLGALLFLAKRRLNKESILIIFWLILAPIPAALAIGPGYAANRAVIAIPAVQVILTLGVWQLYGFVVKLTKKVKNVLLGTFVLISVIIFASFLEDYLVISPERMADGMVYGSLQAAEWFVDENLLSEKIVVSRTVSEPHIYFAFATKYDPEVYQKYSANWDYKGEGYGWIDQMSSWRLGNFVFGDIHYDDYQGQDTYLVGKPEEFPEAVVPEKKITLPNGKTKFLIVNTNPDMFADYR